MTFLAHQQKLDRVSCPSVSGASGVKPFLIVGLLTHALVSNESNFIKMLNKNLDS